MRLLYLGGPNHGEIHVGDRRDIRPSYIEKYWTVVNSKLYRVCIQEGEDSEKMEDISVKGGKLWDRVKRI